jgi:hypothetical protein
MIFHYSNAILFYFSTLLKISLRSYIFLLTYMIFIIFYYIYFQLFFQMFYSFKIKHTLFMFVLNSHLFFLIYEYHINREINALHYNDSFKSFQCVKL